MIPGLDRGARSSKRRKHQEHQELSGTVQKLFCCKVLEFSLQHVQATIWIVAKCSKWHSDKDDYQLSTIQGVDMKSTRTHSSLLLIMSLKNPQSSKHHFDKFWAHRFFAVISLTTGCAECSGWAAGCRETFHCGQAYRGVDQKEHCWSCKSKVPLLFFQAVLAIWPIWTQISTANATLGQLF